jgi:hypothetical protein
MAPTSPQPQARRSLVVILKLPLPPAARPNQTDPVVTVPSAIETKQKHNEVIKKDRRTLLKDKSVDETSIVSGTAPAKDSRKGTKATASDTGLQIQELMDTVCSQAAKIAQLERLLEGQGNELKTQKKACTQDHLPDLAELGAALARARGISRGNAIGMKTWFKGDNLPKLLIQRLLVNPVFQRNILEGLKKRKWADNDDSWRKEEEVLKIEDDD